MPFVIERLPCVYIMASGHNGRLYVGVTSNLVGRVVQHREGRFGGHTAKYAIKRLVYFEMAETMEAAILREKQLKRWRRDWKRNIIERQNPAWNDLAVALGLEPLRESPGFPVDPGTSPG
jgi:putative endonuclease